MGRTFTVTIPAPTRWMNSNDRRSAKVNAPDIKLWRDAARQYARAARLPKLGACRITARVSLPANRVRDSPNYYPTIKAAIDGLKDGEVFDDDNDGHVYSLTIEPGPPFVRKPYGPTGVLVLLIREVA